MIAQRLRFRPDLNIRVPECEVLIPSNPVKAHIRNRDFFKIMSALEIGAEHGMWTFQRYCTWQEKRSNWHVPGQSSEPPDSETEELAAGAGLPMLASAPKPDLPAAKTKSAAPGPGGDPNLYNGFAMSEMTQYGTGEPDIFRANFLGHSLTVLAVRHARGASDAEVWYTEGSVQPGSAVLDRGRWTVSRATWCQLTFNFSGLACPQ